MRDRNFGAKDHLRQIFLDRKPTGRPVSEVIGVIVVIVSRETERKGGRDVTVGN